MKTKAFSAEHGTLKEAILSFVQFTRAHGLQVGVQESLDALSAAKCGLIQTRQSFRCGLRALFCTSREDTFLFDRLFDSFWNVRPDHKPGGVKKTVNPSGFQRRRPASLVMLGQGKKALEEEEGSHVSGAHVEERLRKTDFSQLTDMESEQLEALANRLWEEMGRRLRRRLRKARQQGRIDLRKTIRRNISRGGDPIELVLKNRKARKQRLVVLLDISGSMDKYSFFLLRFIFALSAHFRQLEVFLFSTHLQRITPLLKDKGLQAALRLLSEQSDHWSSGTRIGECLRAFNESYGLRILNGQPLVIIFSDGLDTGGPEILRKALDKIAGKAGRLIWLNPLKGTRGYEPSARGMQAALPYLDDFEAANHFDSLLELENLLTHV